jgi:ABC-type lipoprotein export system ATPase subunit
MANALQDLSGEEVALVSPELPLRANLSARENIALIPLYQKSRGAAESSTLAQLLLDKLGFAAIGDKRDPDMSPTERFIAKTARALILHRSRLIIERPGAMLYDIPYPAFLREVAARIDEGPSQWEVFDFEWNRPLYG